VDLLAACEKVSALTAPKNVVIVGASDKAGSWSARVWRNLHRYGFPRSVYPVNPHRNEIWDQVCYNNFGALPERPDHLVILTPATQVVDALRTGAAAGARSATIFSAGFGEGYGASGILLSKDLAAAIKETGLSVNGPNCMGNICARSSFVTLVEDRRLNVGGGPIALVGQSGGVMVFLNQALEERGLNVDYLITSGNEIGLCISDYIAFLAAEADLKVIVVYIEALKGPDDFRQACLAARSAGKSIIAVKLGQSDAGRSAAMAHTGSLAGSMESFDALAADVGVIRAHSLDEAVELAELLAHTNTPAGLRLGALTLSGAYRGLLLDAAERNGLIFPDLAPETKLRIDRALGIGSLVSNPIDGGFSVLTSEAAYRECIEALRADTGIDMVLLQESLPRAAGSNRAERYIRIIEEYASQPGKPLACVTLASHGQSDYSRDLRATAYHVPFLQEANKALHAIRAAVERDRLFEISCYPVANVCVSDDRLCIIEHVKKLTQGGSCTLSEPESKKILKAYGFSFPVEEIARNLDGALTLAHAIGYPIVMKGVSNTLQHKSDVGAVVVGVCNDDSLAEAWRVIARNVEAAGHDQIDGVLIAKQAPDGLELVIGLHRDLECGFTFMFGAGGVLLELINDVSFASAPMSREKALDMVSRTKVARLIHGYRGSKSLDPTPLVDALMGLAALSVDLGQFIQSVDINPLRLLPSGAVVLDGLVVLRASDS
jgi:acetyltransferase